MTGQDMKALRERRGESQQAFAGLLNAALGKRYTSATISQWELGKRDVPRAVDVLLDELALTAALGGADTPTVDPPPPGDEPPPPAAKGDEPPGPGRQAPPTPQLAISPGGGTYARVCTELWGMIATGVGMMGAVLGSPQLVQDGAIIDADKEALGRAYGRLAETNDTFRRMLVGATSSGVWLEVALVTGGTLSMCWRNHQETRVFAATNGTGDHLGETAGLA